MASPFTFTINIVPQGKGRARARYVQPRGRPGFTTLYTPAATRKYEAEIAAFAVKAMRGRQIFEGPLSVTIDAIMPVPASWSNAKWGRAVAGVIRPTGKPDADNILKGVADSCNRVIWNDDAQIVDCRIRKFYGKTPCIIMTVREVEIGLLEAEDAA